MTKLVMTKLTIPIFGLLSLQGNTAILEMCHGVLNFPFFWIQLKNADPSSSYLIETLLIFLALIRQRSRRTVLCVKTKIHTNIESRGILQTSRLSESDEDIFICPTPSKTQINKHNFEIGFLSYTIWIHLKVITLRNFFDYDSWTNESH